MLEKRKIIFGIGNQVRNMATYFLENDNNNIISVVDNDSRKWGQETAGGFIVQPVKSIMQYVDAEGIIVIITAHSAYEKMKIQLLDMGWNEEKILVAIKEISFFSSYEYKCYINGIDLYNPQPTLLNIELSGFCNCKCIYCPFHGEMNLKEGHKGLMNEDTMNAIIKKVKEIPSIKTVDTTGPGEIFINKNWFELLQKLLDATNIEEVYMYTNGMLLTEDNINKIARLHAKKVQLEISIDGVTPDENDIYRIGSKYEEIKRNVYRAKEIFANYNKNIKIVITNCYPAELEEIEKMEYHVDSKKYQIPQFLKNDYSDCTIASQITFYYGNGIELSKFKKVEVSWKNTENRCMNLFYRIAIDYKGNLLRCSCGHAGLEPIGNVFKDDILKIWKEEKEIELARESFIKGIEKSDFCVGCPGKGLGKYYILVRK